MGNNAACKVIGFGKVKIKMYDDIIRSFGNVRHVPSLKKNLISLGTLDASGLTYSLQVDARLRFTRAHW